MAIRLNPELKSLAAICGIILLAFVILFLICWGILSATGCAAAKVDRLTAEVKVAEELRIGIAEELKIAEELRLNAEAALVKYENKSASPATTAGDNATITNVNVGTGIGCMALVPLLGLLAWRHRTATGTLDRVITVVKSRSHQAMVAANYVEATELRLLRHEIEKLGYPAGLLASKPDRQERFLRSRLAKMK